MKIETGMNRLGVRPGPALHDLLNLVKSLDNLEVVGVYTHFATSTADYYDTFAVEQFEKFKEAVSQIETSGITLKYIHCCNSAATTWYKRSRRTLYPCALLFFHPRSHGDGRWQRTYRAHRAC